MNSLRPEKLVELRAAIESGATIRDAAHRIGVALGTIARYRRLFGVERTRSDGMREYHRRRRAAVEPADAALPDEEPWEREALDRRLVVARRSRGAPGWRFTVRACPSPAQHGHALEGSLRDH